MCHHFVKDRIEEKNMQSSGGIEVFVAELEPQFWK